MSALGTQIEQLKKEFNKQLAEARDAAAVEAIRVHFLGRQGSLTGLLKQLKELSADDKRVWGPQLNQLKQEWESVVDQAQKACIERVHQAAHERKKQFDVTAYTPGVAQGSLHPYTLITQEIENLFMSMGCSIVDGPEVETGWHNFDALNVPKNHPARDAHDTFWLTLPGTLLRTHTSSVQIRTLATKKPPLAIVASGRAFRHEATDASHDCVFMQTEGLWIAKDISVANLMATATMLLRALFNRDDLTIRVRPGYFPFVEPGLEIDMRCPFCAQGCSVCKKNRWIEIMGAGLVHPNVLNCTGVDPQVYSGFAFGFGLTRLAMLKYGIRDIRLLHSDKIEFLEQF